MYKSSALGSSTKKARSYSADLRDASQTVEPWAGDIQQTNASTPALNVNHETNAQAADRISTWRRNVESESHVNPDLNGA